MCIDEVTQIFPIMGNQLDFCSYFSHNGKTNNNNKRALMRIISNAALERGWAEHPEAEQPLKAWRAIAKNSEWNTPQDIKDRFSSASFVGDRIVFNIAGNKYRLVVGISYTLQACYIKFFGTHAEYDKINVKDL